MGTENTYSYDGVENEYAYVTEKHIIDVMFKTYERYTDHDKYTETKAVAKEMVQSIENAYQEIMNLSHESSLNNDRVHKVSDIMQFMMENGRPMDKNETREMDEYIAQADELIAEKMGKLMESLNDIFEEYGMECRFMNLDDPAEIRYQAQELEIARLEGPINVRQLMKNYSMQSQEDRRIASTGEHVSYVAESKFENYARNRGYNDSGSYEEVQSKVLEKFEEKGIKFENPDFARDDNSELVGSF